MKENLRSITFTISDDHYHALLKECFKRKYIQKHGGEWRTNGMSRLIREAIEKLYGGGNEL